MNLRLNPSHIVDYNMITSSSRPLTSSSRPITKIQAKELQGLQVMIAKRYMLELFFNAFQGMLYIED